MWHNPDVLVPRRFPVQRRPSAAPEADAATRAGADVDGAEVPAPAPSSRRQVVRPAVDGAAAAPLDEREAERGKLLEKLRVAEGRTAITRAEGELRKAGFELPPDDQEVHLQLLQHADEEIILAAIERIDRILDDEPPKRVAMLDSRLRRLAELADDPRTQEAAGRLRRRVAGS